MGYSTYFHGKFNLDRKLLPEHLAYLTRFSETRRMKRNIEITATLPDPIREATSLPLGIEGGHYVGSTDPFGQEHSPDVLDYNEPPRFQPGLWCKWTPTVDGLAIEWNGGEKFYNYVEWLVYLIDEFLNSWNYMLNGEVDFQGEERRDFGVIVVNNNKVSVSRRSRKRG